MQREAKVTPQQPWDFSGSYPNARHFVAERAKRVVDSH